MIARHAGTPRNHARTHLRALRSVPLDGYMDRDSALQRHVHQDTVCARCKKEIARARIRSCLRTCIG